MLKIKEIIKTIIKIQYLVVIILIYNNYKCPKNRIINKKKRIYKYIHKINEYDSMYSLMYKYYDKFLNNTFEKKDDEYIKFKKFIGNNKDNYFAIGNKIIIYFYKNKGKCYINTSPLFFDDINKNFLKISKYYKNYDIIKILTAYKYGDVFDLYRYSNSKFTKIAKKKIEGIIDKIYKINYAENSNEEIILYGTCLGGNVCCKIYNYMNLKYHLKLKLITFETYFYERPNFKNHINIYTYNSLFYWNSKINKYRIDYVYKIDSKLIIQYLLENNMFIPIINYDNYCHWKYHFLLRKRKI
jgi:hypothetical protein